MKRNKIFPVSVLNQSELFLYEIGKYSPKLYIIVLIAVIIAFVSLFFIEVDVSVKTSGIIKPKGEKSIITSPISGRIKFMHLEENQAVQKGDTLFVIQADHIIVSQEGLETRKTELESMISDLIRLSPASNIWNFKPKTSIYTQELLHFKSQLSDLQQKVGIVASKYERNKALFAEQVIPKADFDQIEFEYLNAKTAETSFITQQKSTWTIAKNQYEVELRDIKTKLSQITIQSNDAIGIAPVDGVVQKILNIRDGAYVHSAQQITEISPEGDLFVECFVSPKDIGLLNVGIKGKFQVDAFNYNDWGMLSGDIVEIFNDIEADQNNNTYYYKIYCQLDSYELYLKNGYPGHIKKGMTVNVRFIITRRTLFQLLYDKIDNWLNPNLTTE